jgi:Ca-activated chloride channel homolog
MTFLRPDLAPAILALPLVLAGWLIHRHLRGVFRRRAGVAPRFASISRRTGPGRERAVLAAGILAAASLSLALMRPQATVTRRVPEFERQDLIVMLDRSASMLARDIHPSRFARATLELRNLVKARPPGVDRVALIGFAEAPVVLSYPTADTDSLLFYFDWLDADPAPLFGTDMGAALMTAFEVAARDDPRARKLFLIVSDGEDQGGDLGAAIAAARARGLRVNAIGVGGDRAVPIDIPQPGGRTTPMLDDAGQPVKTRFSEGTLRRIAGATGGRYVRSSTGAELQQAIASIVSGEQRRVGWRTETGRRDLHAAFLAAAAIAAAVLWVLA